MPDMMTDPRPLTTCSAVLRAVEAGALDATLASLGSAADINVGRARVSALLKTFADRYGAEREIAVFSIPGRSEISGNHTDHNHGSVIAASVGLDMLAVAAKRPDTLVRIHSEGFGEDIVDIADDLTPIPADRGTSRALIAGVCAGLSDHGYTIGGMDVCTTSDVLPGSGLSSSAVYENMVGLTQSHLYDLGRVDALTMAKISQYAENRFFGKPCGLMDQIACACGGIVWIDFSSPAAPAVESIPFDLTAAGYRLCIVNTGGNHADLTEDYAAVPAEMKAVAAHFGRSVLGEVEEDAVIAAIPTLRETVGDRAILRALHFFGENRRVAQQKEALKTAVMAAAAADDAARDAALADFFRDIMRSGRSSYEYLQNVYTTKNTAEQGLSLALCLCDRVLHEVAGHHGAYRVHGGGFAGTVQAIVPAELVDGFTATMDAAFGRGATHVLTIRIPGAVRIY